MNPDTGIPVWQRVKNVIVETRSWCRILYSDSSSTTESSWGMLFTVPTQGYVEGSEGPIPDRFVDAVEIASIRISGGLNGISMNWRDNSPAVVSALERNDLAWSRERVLFVLDALLTIPELEVFRVRAQSRSEGS